MSPFSHSNRRSISSSDDSKSSSAVLETFETGSPFQAKRETVPSKMDHSITTSSHHPPNLSESHMAAALSHYDHPNDLIQATMVDNNLARVQLAEAENFDAESEDDEGEEDDKDEDEKEEEPGNVNEEAVESDSSRQANNGEAMKAAIVLGSVPGPSSNDRTTPNVIGPPESIEAGVEYGFVLDDEEIEEEARFLVVCIDGDVEDLVLLLEDMARAGETLTKEMLNYPDNSGRTPVSHLCGNGMIEMLELLEDIPNIEYNTPDSEGNTPLHFAAQAGHVEVVSFLLNKVRTIQVDPVNNLGFSPLMKASIQGRIKCSKLLLFSGASPIRRDPGRGLTAAQWARYCGRLLCADSIEKFIRTAVPGGEALAEEATGKPKKREKEKRFPFMSSSSSGAGSSCSSSSSFVSSGASNPGLAARSDHKSSSWLARKFKKTFFAGSPSGSNSGHAIFFGSPLKKNGRRSGKKKIMVPQVQVTTEESLSGDEENELEYGELDEKTASDILGEGVHSALDGSGGEYIEELINRGDDDGLSMLKMKSKKNRKKSKD